MKTKKRCFNWTCSQLSHTTNISASVPQLKEAIAELQDHGYTIPTPEDPKTRKKRKLKQNIQSLGRQWTQFYVKEIWS
jgi:monomeric isocitrate dehydrogenase